MVVIICLLVGYYSNYLLTDWFVVGLLIVQLSLSPFVQAPGLSGHSLSAVALWGLPCPAERNLSLRKKRHIGVRIGRNAIVDHDFFPVYVYIQQLTVTIPSSCEHATCKVGVFTAFTCNLMVMQDGLGDSGRILSSRTIPLWVRLKVVFGP